LGWLGGIGIVVVARGAGGNFALSGLHCPCFFGDKTFAATAALLPGFSAITGTTREGCVCRAVGDGGESRGTALAWKKE
jgi:hypothetical protein